MTVDGMAETGIVKWFDGKKGYGFITRSNGEKDVFVHATDLRKSGIEDEDVDEGQALQFEIATTPRGLKAVKLTRIEADGNAGGGPLTNVVDPDPQAQGVVADAVIPDPEAK
jgi:CspA family cold shock protein